MKLKKFDEELQVVYGEVYIPDVLDAQGDFMTAETIRRMAHRFLEQSRVDHIDIAHNEVKQDASVVESFIARQGDPDFIDGSWVVGVHVRDRSLWEAVKKGEYNGFSLAGEVEASSEEVEVLVPEYVSGQTEKAEGHTHRFTVSFGAAGEFLGGITDEGAGHAHAITSGSATEMTAGHSHRFHFVEELVRVNSAGA
jgi:hypothetical protein